jgi:ribosomal protein S18 acetylase RimI-like enzyme
MNCPKIEYRKNTASIELITDHFNSCADSFNPPLYTYVVIEDYAKKIFDHAVTFEAWDEDKLVGLSAVYYNNITERIAFWTNLSLLDAYQNKGIASELTSYVIDHGRTNGFKRIDLEVKSINEKVKQFYKKHGFVITGKNKECYVMTYYIR